MLDADPALIEYPYYDEMRIDGEVALNGSLVQTHDELFAVVYQEHETEKSIKKAHVEQPKLVLYIRPTCPYCVKVLNYLKSVNKTVPMKDIGKDAAAAKELVDVGGKRQVPCLFINGKPLYESNAIIKWFKNNPNKF